MSGKTTIEWTAMPGYVGAVWNPTTGCTRVSAGCNNCYAFALHDKRYKANSDAAKAAGFVAFGGRTHDIGIARNAGARVPYPKQYDLPFSRVQLLKDCLDVPLRTRKPTCYFVDSMADLFHEDVPDEYLDRVFAAMALASRHRFLILTKRPERMRRYVSRHDVGLRWAHAASAREPLVPAEIAVAWSRNGLPNVWLGTSVEDQKAADERIPHLLATPAAVRFLSCEPLLASVDIRRWLSDTDGTLLDGPRLDWAIVGGESGSRARPMDLAWARSLVEQCSAAGLAVFVKQLGSKPIGRTVGFAAEGEGFRGQWTTALMKLRESHGRDMSEWPEDLRVREWPRG